jgi:hypothetical protein
MKQTLRSWLAGALGNPQVFTIDFDVDFVTGNLINGNVGGVLTTVPFAVDQATTIAALAKEIQKKASIFKARVTEPDPQNPVFRQITCKVNGNGLSIPAPTLIVTGGATQAEATFETTQEPVSVLVIFENENGPHPGDDIDSTIPYATIRLDDSESAGQDDVRSEDDEGIVVYSGQRTATVSVNYYGPLPLEEVSKASNSLETQSVKDFLISEGISIGEKNQIRDLTEIMETEYQKRAFFDFSINFSDGVEDDVGVIESAELTGELSGARNGTITVGPKIITV